MGCAGLVQGHVGGEAAAVVHAHGHEAVLALLALRGVAVPVVPCNQPR